MRDIGMVQCGEHFRLTLESGESLRIVGDRLGEHLDGDDSFQVRVHRSIDLAHAAGTEQGDDLIRTKAGGGL